MLLWALVLLQVHSEPVDFAKTVHPIFASRCLSCHSGSKGQAGLSLIAREEMLKGGLSGPALIPGNSGKSLLMKRIRGDGGSRMPMGGDPLPPADVDRIAKWIDEGAITNSAAASTRRYSLALKAPAADSVDQLMATYYERNGIPLARPVSDAVFARRVYLDLWGLPPTPEQLTRFEQDKRPVKRALLVDALLAEGKPYAEHWITFWNDLLHNDQGVTFYGDRESITPWLLSALEKNLPYDQFARSLLAPDEKTDPHGFLKGVTWRGTVNASQQPVMQAAQNSAQVFLGINLKCNSCHDSFISHWKLDQAYQLASFFSDKPLEISRCDQATGRVASPRFLFPEIGSVDSTAKLKERRKAVAAMFTARENGLFPRTFVNRTWRALFGRGLVDPVDEMEAPSWYPELLDWLSSEFVNHGYDVRWLLKAIMTSEPYQRPSVPTGKLRDPSYVFRGPWPRRLTAEQFSDALAAITGEWRVGVNDKPIAGTYSREWQFKSSSLTRALGRPMRDAAVTERQSDSTTLQLLELTNGDVLTGILHDGAKRMLNELEPAPAPLWDSGLLRMRARAKLDLDIKGRNELHLYTLDVDSYDGSRVVATWFDVKLTGPGGSVRLNELVDRSRFEARKFLAPDPKRITPGSKKKPKDKPVEGVSAKLPYDIVLKLPPGKYNRMRGFVAIDADSATNEIGAAYRSFVFTETPNPERLVAVQGNLPAPRTPVATAADDLVKQVYRHALGRTPTADEMAVALRLVAPQGRAVREGLQDFLWILAVSPEFQFIL